MSPSDMPGEKWNARMAASPFVRRMVKLQSGEVATNPLIPPVPPSDGYRWETDLEFGSRLTRSLATISDGEGGESVALLPDEQYQIGTSAHGVTAPGNTG